MDAVDITKPELEKLIDQTIADKVQKIKFTKEQYLSTLLTNLDSRILETTRKRKECPEECKKYLGKKFENDEKAAKRLKYDLPKSEVETFSSSTLDSIIHAKFKDTAKEFASMVSVLKDEDAGMSTLPTSIKVKSDVFCKFDKCCIQYSHPETELGNSKQDMSIMSATKNHSLAVYKHKSKSLLSNIEENAMEESENNSFHTDGDGETSNFHLTFLGAIMAVCSSLCFSICSLIVKYLKNIDPLELSTVRFTGILLPTMFIVIWVNENPLGPKEKRWILLLRAICGAMSLMLQFYAIRHMPLADASVIIFSAPVFVAITARIFLKEYFGVFNVGMILLTVCGVVFITKPPLIFGSNVYQVGFNDETLKGVITAMIGTVFNSNVYVLLRHLKDVHYSVIMLTFAIIAIVMSASATFAGQILLTKALQFEQAGPVAIYRTSDIVFAFIWQSIFFKEVPNLSNSNFT
uniref:EamA domain-containing protein n=1 Tax=Strigamia maritima TaxID=126957 RepID=T1JH76_STRMM